MEQIKKFYLNMYNSCCGHIENPSNQNIIIENPSKNIVVEKTSIKYVCSLGTYCQSAQIIKDLNLRSGAFPFDWVFSNPSIIRSCLKDDFTTFLDKTHYIDIQDKWNNNQCGHYIYGPNFFNHKDPRHDIDYNYYVRCVERFRNILKAEESKLFMIIYNNLHNLTQDMKNDILELNDHLSKKTTNYKILVININHASNQMYNFTSESNVDFLEVYLFSHTNGVYFENVIDNIFIRKVIKEKYDL